MSTITLCHYTDPNSASSIDMSKMIFASVDTITDAIWGPGTYFTDLNPYNSTAQQIAFNNWKANVSNPIKQKLKFCIMVTFQSSEIQQCFDDDRRIFLYHGHVDLRRYTHHIVKTNFFKA